MREAIGRIFFFHNDFHTVCLVPAEMVTVGTRGTLLLSSSHVALFIAAMAEVVACLLLQTAGWHPGGDT